VASLPVERLIATLLRILRFQGQLNGYLATPVFNILFTLSSIDAELWMKILRSGFEGQFYAMAVECQNESIRENSWNCLLAFFTSLCRESFAITNGNGDHSDSDNENKMDIDRTPAEGRDVILFIWEVAIGCMRNSHVYISQASKAFETGANMLRYFSIELYSH
jgi:hypothetical protein